MLKDESLSEWATRLSPMITEVQVLIARLAKELLGAATKAPDCSEPLLMLNECISLTEGAWLGLERVDYTIKRLAK